MTVYLRETQNNIGQTKKNAHGEDITTVIMYILILTSFFREFLVFAGLDTFSTVCYYAMIAVLAALCGITVIRMFAVGVTKGDIFIFISGVLLTVYVFTASMLSGMDSEAEKRMIGIIILILFLSCEKIIVITPGVFKFFLWMNFIQSLYLAAGIFIPSFYIDGELIYRYASTNHSGIINMLAAVQLFIMFMYYLKQKKGFIAAAALIMTAVMVFACYLTKSRACILSVILFFVISFAIMLKRKAAVPLAVVVFVLVALIPLAWVLLYQMVGGKNDIELFGETVFTGRELIWQHIIKSFVEEPFALHITERINVFLGIDISAHNAIWDIAWSYTMWFAAAVTAFLFAKIYGVYKQINGKITTLFYAGLLIVVFHMSFETAFLSSAVNFTLKAFLLIPMMRGVIDDVPFKTVGGGTGIQRSKYLK